MNLFIVGAQSEYKYRFICYLGKYLSGKYRVGIVSLYKKDNYTTDIYEIEEQEDMVINCDSINAYQYDVVLYDVNRYRGDLPEGKKVYYTTIDKSYMDKNKLNFSTCMEEESSILIFDNLPRGSSIDKRFLCKYLLGDIQAKHNLFCIHSNLEVQKILLENDYKQRYSLKRLKGEYRNTIINICNLVGLTGGDEAKEILRICERR